MAFTFDYTLKGATSNSYVPLETYTDGDYTIEGANDYFDGHPKQAMWDGLSDAEKQQYLVKATYRLNMEKWGGDRSESTQRLQFPRNWVVSRDQEADQERYDAYNGEVFQDPNINPLEINQATFELALWYIEEWLEENPLFSRNDQSRMSKVTIGPLSADLRKEKEDALPDLVKRLLTAAGPGLWQGGGLLRVVR